MLIPTCSLDIIRNTVREGINRTHRGVSHGLNSERYGTNILQEDPDKRFWTPGSTILHFSRQTHMERTMPTPVAASACHHSSLGRGNPNRIPKNSLSQGFGVVSKMDADARTIIREHTTAHSYQLPDSLLWESTHLANMKYVFKFHLEDAKKNVKLSF